MSLRTNVRHGDNDLRVLDLAETTAPLPRRADRLRPLLGNAEVEYDHAARHTEVRDNLTDQRPEPRLMSHGTCPRNCWRA